MSKKKNTLKDLDDFLKQQAATLVAPTALSDTLKETVKETKQDTSVAQVQTEVSISSILQDIYALSEKEGQGFRKKFYDLIVKSLESLPSSSSEDKMLINTALYLKNPESWKETIRAYWKERSH